MNARVVALFALTLTHLAACDAPVTDASKFSQDEMGICYFEATLPATAQFEDIAKPFAYNAQFCSWKSFDERKLIGHTSPTTPETRSGWEILNGAPPPTARVCNIQPMLDAGWKLRPRTFLFYEERFRACGRYGIPMSRNAVAIEGEAILSLPQLCFETMWGDEAPHDAGFRLAGVGGTLPMRWTLPVRFFDFDEDKGHLRLWFDDGPQTAWSDDWPRHVVTAAQSLGVPLTEKACGRYTLPKQDPFGSL